MITPLYIVDLFKTMVTASAFTSKAGMAVSFYYGPTDEISATLTEMGKDPAREAYKFPAIILIQDFDENFGGAEGIYCKLPSLRFVVMNISKQEWTAALRYTNNFKPTLYPIFKAFVNSILQSGLFIEGYEKDLKFTKTDRVKWGKEGIPGFDFIDAIDIKNLQLTVIQNQTDQLTYQR